MPQIHMRLDDGRHHLHFWCDCYDPFRIHYPKEKYIKGEEVCNRCIVPANRMIFRADFQCERERTSAITKQEVKELFGWLYGGESKAKRKHAKKVIEASKERTDIHGTEDGTLTRVFYENPVAEKLGEPEAQAGTPEVKSRFELTFGSLPPITNGLSKMSERTMRDNDTPLHGKIYDSQVPEVRSTNNVQIDRNNPVGCVRAVFEPSMSEEYDTSYTETSSHACITCKCGKKVWYGCGKKQTTRPKYCRSCTEIEMSKLKEHLPNVDTIRMHEIYIKELRREIIR